MAVKAFVIEWSGTAMPGNLSPSLQTLPPPSPQMTPRPGAEMQSRRYLALWLAFLPAERALAGERMRQGERQDERPFVLIEKAQGGLRIAAVDALAVRHQLRAGMTLSEARALTPKLRTAEINRAGDEDYLRACAAACEIFTPLAGLRGTDGLILDITGCAHLFGAEAGLLTRARQQMRKLGLSARAAIASTPDAAWTFARHGKGGIIGNAELETLARALPVSALEEEAGVTQAIEHAGLRTLGDLAERPSHMLTARFGARLTPKLRRILGYEDIRITPLRAPPDLMAERHFPEPLTQMDALLAALERLARDIAGALEQRGEGARAFEASFFRSDGAVRRLLIETAQAARDPETVLRLARLKLDALSDPLDPGFGFDALRLSVLHSEPLSERQQDMQPQTPHAAN
ncbi:MAG: DNA polymerase Y family protein, partial [Alphaproteobacteria bacterium]|nr:DNA polymerase Y family protein [Alphaproteobacteria bacterium]